MMSFTLLLAGMALLGLECILAATVHLWVPRIPRNFQAWIASEWNWTHWISIWGVGAIIQVAIWLLIDFAYRLGRGF